MGLTGNRITSRRHTPCPVVLFRMYNSILVATKNKNIPENIVFLWEVPPIETKYTDYPTCGKNRRYTLKPEKTKDILRDLSNPDVHHNISSASIYAGQVVCSPDSPDGPCSCVPNASAVPKSGDPSARKLTISAMVYRVPSQAPWGLASAWYTFQT